MRRTLAPSRRSLGQCLGLSLLLLPAVACEKPPAAEPTTPPDETAQAEPADGEATDAPGDTAAADLPSADEVLGKAIEAVGGKDKVDAIKTSYVESKTELKGQNMTFVTKIWTKDDKFYVETDMPGMGLSQVWKNGDEIWSLDPINGKRQLEGKEAAQARWSADPLLAANWNKYFDEANTIARSGEGDQEAYEVELSRGEDKLVLLFSVANGLPLGQRFTQETPMGEMPIKISYEDYREVEGVMTPFRSVTDMQVMSAEQTTDKYEVNLEIDDAKFVVPK